MRRMSDPRHRRAADFLLFFLATPIAAAVPPVPTQAIPTCDAVTHGRCYNRGDFTLAIPASGADHYRVCRSHDTSGWGGCNEIVSNHTGPSLVVSGTDVPTDGFRRAYYWSACDATNQCTKWADNPEIYVYRDAAGPSAVSIVTNQTWVVDDGGLVTLTVVAEDSGSGVAEIRTAIDLPATGGGEGRGLFAWRAEKHRFAADQVSCTGGGFASKHPKWYRATTVTLVSCTTSATGTERSVTFTLRPNATFGAIDAFDVSSRGWDHAGNRSPWQRFDLDLRSLRPNDQLGELIGYQGILDEDGLDQAVAEGIGVNLATLLYQRRQCAPFFWQTVDTAGILAAYRAQNVQAMVILENFLFRNVNDPHGDDCQPLEPPPPLDPSPCFNNNKWRLFADWESRLDAFVALHGVHMSAQDIAFFLVSSEVNDRCFDLAEVEAVALAVRERFPRIPLAMIYGATHHPDGGLDSQPPPPFFPPVFDIVGLFSYEIFDVNDPLEPRNVTSAFYDPQQPANPLTVYGDLLSKLHSHQAVMLVFDANVNPRKQLLGWQPGDLGRVARNYTDFMHHRPEATMMGGFTWQRLLALPQSVLDEHGTIACSRFANTSPMCASP